MSYHASDPNMTTARTYVDTSQPLMGLGADAVPADATGLALNYSNYRTGDPLIAPWASDVDLHWIDSLQQFSLPPNRNWALGPWIPNEGPTPRTVALEFVGGHDPNQLTLGQWLVSASKGLLTGNALYVVMGVVNGHKVLYVVDDAEYRALPPNTYQTVALVANVPSTKEELSSRGLLYGPVLNGGVPAGGGGGGGGGTFPSLPGGNWGNVFPASIPGVGGGGFWPFPSPGGGAGGSGTTQPAQPAQPGSAGLSVAGLTGGALLVLVAAAAGAYYLYSRPGGFRMNGHRSSYDLEDEC